MARFTLSIHVSCKAFRRTLHVQQLRQQWKRVSTRRPSSLRRRFSPSSGRRASGLLIRINQMSQLNEKFAISEFIMAVGGSRAFLVHVCVHELLTPANGFASSGKQADQWSQSSERQLHREWRCFCLGVWICVDAPAGLLPILQLVTLMSFVAVGAQSNLSSPSSWLLALPCHWRCSQCNGHVGVEVRCFLCECLFYWKQQPQVA